MSFRKLPPFQSLIAFESAARKLSFREAADELFLTPPAITYRIKELESLLGLELFVRAPRGLELTSAGSQYYEDVSKALSSLQQSTQTLTSSNQNQQIYVQMLPFLASEIVIPQLSDFYQQFPSMQVQIDTKYAVSDFQREKVDLAIRFGLGDWGEELVCEKLMEVKVSAVCSAHYAKESGINSVDDLTNATIVSLANEKYNWSSFFQQAGMKQIKPAREIFFNDYTLCLRAAENHMGVTLGIKPMIENWIQAKRLVEPFELEIELPQAYYLVSKPDNDKQEAISAFTAWLKELIQSECNKVEPS